MMAIWRMRKTLLMRGLTAVLTAYGMWIIYYTLYRLPICSSSKEPRIRNSARLYQNARYELTVRMPINKKMTERFFCELMRSAVLFWASEYGPITLLLDEQDKGKEFPIKLPTLGLPYDFRIHYISPPKNVLEFQRLAKFIGRSYGYLRQLYDSYIFDLYTNASVIAWTDTDTVFTTVVTPKRIMRNGKLLVKGMNSFGKLSWLNGWNEQTISNIGLPMVSDFMVFFPVYLYPSTVRNCREFIMKRFNHTTFEDAFIAATYDGGESFPSPVSILLSYAYYFERDFYEWHLDIGRVSLDEYNKRFSRTVNHVRLEDIQPDLHATLHTKYYDGFLEAFSQSYCSSRKAIQNITHLNCQELVEDRKFLLYEFSKAPLQNHKHTWCAGETGQKTCLKLLDIHYMDAQHWVRGHTHLLDPTWVTIVEDIAECQFKIKCPAMMY